MKPLLLPLAFLLGLSTANAATITTTVQPTSGPSVTTTQTVADAAIPTIAAALMADPVYGFVTVTTTTPAVPAVMAADGVTVITPAVPATTATQRNPATAQQALQAYGAAQIQKLIDMANAYALAQQTAKATAAVNAAFTPIVGQ